MQKFIEFVNNYQIGNLIGQGRYGEVRVVNHMKSSKLWALRVIEKDALEKDESLMKRFETEILLQSTPKFAHTNMLALHELYTDKKWYMMIYKYLEGGELFTQIERNRLNKKYYTEQDAKSIIYELLLCVQHCNLNDIIIGDLKPENILFSSKEKTHLQLIDF